MLQRTHTLILTLATLALFILVVRRINPYRAENFPAPGTLVDVGGYKLHINRSGKGNPSVILDAGFACFSSVWCLVQPEISHYTSVYSYDRAGLGWSEASPNPRTSCNMVKELHTLLETVGAPKPYILVGHSFGGVVMQLYANTYPEDVFGLVLVDSSHERLLQQSSEFNRTYYELLPWPLRTWHRFLYWCGLTTVSTFTGVRAIYLQSLAKNGIATIPPTLKNTFISRLLSVQGIVTRSQEMWHIEESHEQLARSTNQFKNKPLIVVSRGKAVDTDCDTRPLWPYLTKIDEVVWQPLQKDLVTKSTIGKQIIAEKSGHTIVWSEPELIIDAVKELVDLFKQA